MEQIYRIWLERSGWRSFLKVCAICSVALAAVSNVSLASVSVPSQTRTNIRNLILKTGTLWLKKKSLRQDETSVFGHHGTVYVSSDTNQGLPTLVLDCCRVLASLISSRNLVHRGKPSPLPQQAAAVTCSNNVSDTGWPRSCRIGSVSQLSWDNKHTLKNAKIVLEV